MQLAPVPPNPNEAQRQRVRSGEEEQRSERALTFLQTKKSEQAIRSLLRRSGGQGGIRTHVPLRTTAFRVRLVMTTSIPVRMNKKIISDFGEKINCYFWRLEKSAREYPPGRGTPGGLLFGGFPGIIVPSQIEGEFP